MTELSVTANTGSIAASSEVVDGETNGTAETVEVCTIEVEIDGTVTKIVVVGELKHAAVDIE